MKKNILAFIILMVGFSLIFGTGVPEKSDKLRVVTTTSIISDVVFEIAGDSIELYRLIPSGQDPHSYEPTPHDMAQVEKADLIIVNGLDLEEGLISIIQKVHSGKIIEVSNNVDLLFSDEIDHGEDHHHGIDPHTWMSPVNVIAWSEFLSASLSEIDPVHSGLYKENTLTYITKLERLHKWIQDSLAVIPESERVLVTDHSVFGYFAREYHFRTIGTLLGGFSTSTESSAREITVLLNLLKSENVSAVFIGESSGDNVRKLAETIRNESNERIGVFELLTGSLRKPGLEGDSYISLMEYNTKQIISGLTRS